jgi:hypothetical protein
MLNRVRVILGIVLVAVIGVIIWSYITGARVGAPHTPAATTTPEAVAKPGQQVQEAPPPLSSRVTILKPAAGAAVGKTFAVEGEAPGNWYFEASFPIQVRDGEGNVIGRGIAQAQSDWMTTALVPFKAEVTLSGEYTGPARLILLRDNPSGLPEHDDAIEVEVVIK